MKKLVKFLLYKFFPEQLKDISVDKFYAAINKSEPSLIRVESDELTYSLHIMIRYEIEKELIEGKISLAIFHLMLSVMHMPVI